MDTKSIFNHVLLERQCVQNRYQCNHVCRNCQFSGNLLERDEALSCVLEILKSRCPELYFADDVTHLQEYLQSIGKDRENNADQS